MKFFLSCDWGTSAFRLRLVEADGAKIIEEENLQQGIAETFRLWKEQAADETRRMAYYLAIIERYISAIENKSGVALDDVPLLISGMASSSIGMVELPYKRLPASATGADLIIHHIERTQECKHPVMIVSGLRTDDDVMRGEETKLAGCIADASQDDGHLYIFPGTHPKHAEVTNQQIMNFKTFMTGEFFDLLLKKSILSVSVVEGDSLLESNIKSFEQGVKAGAQSNLLHACFTVRTNQLFQKLTAEENYYYLSGLLIGTELQSVAKDNQNITIVGNSVISSYYLKALQVLHIPGNGLSPLHIDGDEALVKGQLAIYNSNA